MSSTTPLAIIPGTRPLSLAEWRNAHGWAPSIWRRLLEANGLNPEWIHDDTGLIKLWHDIEHLPEHHQAPLVLTFDTGVIPGFAFDWCVDQLIEFEAKHPAPATHVNHVPAMIELLQSRPECVAVGVWGTSVTDNPFDPWDDDLDDYGDGCPIQDWYVLPQHRKQLACLTRNWKA